MFEVVNLLYCDAGGWIVDLILGVMLMIEEMRIDYMFTRGPHGRKMKPPGSEDPTVKKLWLLEAVGICYGQEVPMIDQNRFICSCFIYKTCSLEVMRLPGLEVPTVKKRWLLEAVDMLQRVRSL